MDRKVHYATVSEALENLRKQGFELDFNLDENCLSCHVGKFEAHDFEIVAVYRYEGDSDPADEATVYAIASKTGEKGVLVTGYGISTDQMSTDIIKKLSGHPYFN
jgi:cytochrome c peroxidase